VALLLVAQVSASATFNVGRKSKSANNPLFSKGNGNTFTFNGTEQPFLTLTRGETYNFVVGGSCIHPLNISLSSIGGKSFANQVYLDGVTGSRACGGSTLSLAVSANAPSTLYYACAIHGFMGNTIDVVDRVRISCPKGRPEVITSFVPTTVSGGQFNVTGRFEITYNAFTAFINVVKKLVVNGNFVKKGSEQFAFDAAGEFNSFIRVTGGTNGLPGVGSLTYLLTLRNNTLSANSADKITSSIKITTTVNSQVPEEGPTKKVTLGSVCTYGEKTPLITASF